MRVQEDEEKYPESRCKWGTSQMGVEHLQGRRSGRPAGAKSGSAVKRDMMRAYRYLRRPDGKPLPPGVAWWLEVARTQPEKFMDCLLKAESMGAKKPSSSTDRQSDATVCPADDQQTTESGECQETPPTPTVMEQNNNSPAPAVAQTPAPKPTAPPVVKAGKPQKVMGLFVKQSYLGPALMRYRGSVPCDVRVVGAAMDQKGDGIHLTISSESFALIEPGQPIPELPPKYSSVR
jgi:hypothetical protein